MKTESSAACPHCGAESAEAHFCPACGRLKPVSKQTDYFAFFGLPRRLQIDEQQLERTFYDLSRQLHPDYFMTAGEDEREASIERTSVLNDAYRTLRDPVSRIRYLLLLEGRSEEKKKAPPEMLEEVFELNMQIDELKTAKKMGDEDEVNGARSALREALTGLSGKLLEIDQHLLRSSKEWDAAIESDELETRRSVLDQMSGTLSHRAYIRNLISGIEEELEEGVANAGN